jgi:hypothetical protein
MPAFAYYLLIKAANEKVLEETLNTLFLIVSIVTPFDEFYLLGKLAKYSVKGIKSVNFAKIKTYATQQKFVIKAEDQAKFASKIETAKMYAVFGDLDILKRFDATTLNQLNKWPNEMLAKLAADLKEFPTFANTFIDLCKTNPRLVESWKIVKSSGFDDLARNTDVISYVNNLSTSPKLGNAIEVPNIAITNYRGRFYATFRNAPTDMQVHHAIPQAVFDTKYPGLITEAQLHSLENLRGIPNSLRHGNVSLHQNITNQWAEFYRAFPNATLDDVLDFTKQIDDEFGHLFIPPIR